MIALAIIAIVAFGLIYEWIKGMAQRGELLDNIMLALFLLVISYVFYKFYIIRR